MINRQDRWRDESIIPQFFFLRVINQFPEFEKKQAQENKNNLHFISGRRGSGDRISPDEQVNV